MNTRFLAALILAGSTGISSSQAAVITETIAWDLSVDGNLHTTPGGFMEYSGIVSLPSGATVLAGNTLEIHLIFKNCARLELRDAVTPEGLIDERLVLIVYTPSFLFGPTEVELEILNSSGALQNNPFSGSIPSCTAQCPLSVQPDLTESSFDFPEFVIRITVPVTGMVSSCSFFFQADFIQIQEAPAAPDLLQSVSASGVPLEYSNALDEQVLADAVGTTLERHGSLDPGQTLYTGPVDVAGNLQPRDANDFFPGIESGNSITNQVDALAYGNDAYLDALLQNDADLFFSIAGDAATDEWALLRETPDGTLSVEYRHGDLVHGNTVGGLDDLDAADLWGPLETDDADYYSLQVDAATGTSVYTWFDGGPVEFLSHAEIQAAAEQLGYQGEPDDIDVDGLMVKNEGGLTCLDGDDVVLFSLRSTANGFFGGAEIIVLRPGVAPEFLQHGDRVWDSTHDLLTRLFDLGAGADLADAPDVDALEAEAATAPVGVGSHPMPSRIRMGGASPNPFNPATEIRFELAGNGQASLVVFDARGRKVATLLDRPLLSGEHVVRWNGRADDGSAVASGAYYARLRALGESKTVKLVLSK